MYDDELTIEAASEQGKWIVFNTITGDIVFKGNYQECQEYWQEH